MLSWPEELMEGLRAEGFRVIRYDNRDVGKTEKLKGLPNVSDVAKVREAVRPTFPTRFATWRRTGSASWMRLGWTARMSWAFPWAA